MAMMAMTTTSGVAPQVTAAPLVGKVTADVVDGFFEQEGAAFSFFRRDWKQHIPFGSAPAEGCVQGCDFGQTASYFFKRDTDSVGPVFVNIVLPRAPGVRWVDRVAFAAIASVQVRLGGVLVDNFDGASLAMYHRAMSTEWEWDGVSELAGGSGLSGLVSHSVYVPLPGILGRGPGCGFPLLACPNSPLQVTVTLTASRWLAVTGTPPATGARVKLGWEMHLLHHLDAGELFSLPFVQTMTGFYTQSGRNYTYDADLDLVTSTSVTFDLSKCYGPCKYVMWSCRPAAAQASEPGQALADSIAITVNGDTFTGAAAGVHADPTTYRLLMPWQRLHRYDGTFYIMSFALDPVTDQPSGETRLDLGSSQLTITLGKAAGAVELSLLVCCYVGVNFSGGTAQTVFT